MNQQNSQRTIWVDTHRVTLAEYEADVSYPLDHQGRLCKTSVPAVSMFAGAPERSAEDNHFRGVFWWFASVVLAALWGALIWSMLNHEEPTQAIPVAIEMPSVEGQ